MVLGISRETLPMAVTTAITNLIMALSVAVIAWCTAATAQDTTAASVTSVSDEAFDATFKSHSADVNGISLHYVRGGSGDESVILIHGWPNNWYVWRTVMPALAETYDVIAVDLRGIGKSSSTGTGWDKKTLAEDIHGLAEALELKTVHIVGHDMGGMVAHAYAVLYPADTKTMTSAEILLPGVEPDWRQFASVLWHWGFHLSPPLTEQLVQGRHVDYFNNFFGVGGSRPGPYSERALQEFYDAYATPEQLTAGFEIYRAMDADAEFIRGAEIQGTVPVLLLGGQFSAGFTMPLLAEGMKKLGHTDVRHEVFPGGSHWVMEDSRDAFLATLISFMQSP
jgi:pimeloyl-ACP methyl ester carboxylesterase